MNFNTIDEAIDAIKRGEMLIVIDDEDRENEGDLVMAAEFITPEKVNFMATKGRGLICTPVSQEIAKSLDLYPMVSHNTESHKCNFTVSIDFKHGTTTGISASDRAKTIEAVANEKTDATDFMRPGHVFPLIAKEGGVLVRAGHTEATIDLVNLAGLKHAGVLCEVAREDGEMMRTQDLFQFAREHKLKIITIRALIEYRRKREKLVELVAKTELPTDFGFFEIKVFKNTVDQREHVVLQKGKIKSDENVLVRVHSECLTGEVFHSLKCDCKLQLDKSLDLISAEDCGVLLYMRDEGRGIGLANKVKAYELQNRGYNTVSANEKLGFGADLRNYGIGAQILSELGCKNIRLLTNNPKKIVGLEGYGINVVERVNIEIPPNENNYSYLKAKKDLMGHFLDNL